MEDGHNTHRPPRHALPIEQSQVQGSESFVEPAKRARFFTPTRVLGSLSAGLLVYGGVNAYESFTDLPEIEHVSYVPSEAPITEPPVSVPESTPPTGADPSAIPNFEATAEPPAAPTAEEIIEASPFKPVPRAPITGVQFNGEQSGVKINATVEPMTATVVTYPDGTVASRIDPETADLAYTWNARATEIGVEWNETVDSADDFTVTINNERAPEIFAHAGLGVGVFGNLKDVKLGDTVTVSTANGVFTYEIVASTSIPKGSAGIYAENNPLIDGTGVSHTIIFGSCIPLDWKGGGSDEAVLHTAELRASDLDLAA